MIKYNTVISEKDTWFFRTSTYFYQIFVNGLNGTDGVIILNGVDITDAIRSAYVFVSTVSPLSGGWQDTYTVVSENSALWDSVFTTVQTNSSLWEETTDISYLSGRIDLNTYQITDMSLVSGNWNNVFNIVQSNSGNWQDAFTNLTSNSAAYLTSLSLGDIPALSGSWNSTFTTVQSNSSQWDESTDVRYLSGRIDNNNEYITVISLVSANWNDSYTNLVNNSAAYLTSVDLGQIPSVSANWNSTYTTVQSNSATTWLGDSAVDSLVHSDSGSWYYQGTDLKALSANWEYAYTNLISNSAAYLTGVDISLIVSTSSNWDSTYSTVQANSALIWNYQGSDLKSLSANWENTSTFVQVNSTQWDESSDVMYLSSRLDSNTQSITSMSMSSILWDTAYTNISINSAAYLTAVDISLISTTSGNWDSTYTIVKSDSASWEAQDLSGLLKLDQTISQLISTESTGTATIQFSSISNAVGGVYPYITPTGAGEINLAFQRGGLFLTPGNTVSETTLAFTKDPNYTDYYIFKAFDSTPGKSTVLNVQTNNISTSAALCLNTMGLWSQYAYLGSTGPLLTHIGTICPSTGDLRFDGTTSRSIVMGTPYSTMINGQNLTIQSGRPQSGRTNGVAGNLILSTNISTGTGEGQIQFRTTPPTTSGVAENTPTLKWLMSGTGTLSGNGPVDATGYRLNGVTGLTTTITTYGPNTNGSMTFVGGILTAQTQAT